VQLQYVTHVIVFVCFYNIELLFVEGLCVCVTYSVLFYCNCRPR